MNRLPVALIAGFGRNTAQALTKVFSQSYRVWDIDNNRLPKDPGTIFHRTQLKKIHGDDSRLLVCGIGYRLQQDFIMRNIAFKFYLGKDLAEGFEDAPVGLFIYNTGFLPMIKGHDDPETRTYATRLDVFCETAVRGFGINLASEDTQGAIRPQFWVCTPRTNEDTRMHESFLLDTGLSLNIWRYFQDDVRFYRHGFVCKTKDDFEEAHDPESLAQKLWSEHKSHK